MKNNFIAFLLLFPFLACFFKAEGQEKMNDRFYNVVTAANGDLFLTAKPANRSTVLYKHQIIEIDLSDRENKFLQQRDSGFLKVLVDGINNMEIATFRIFSSDDRFYTDTLSNKLSADQAMALLRDSSVVPSFDSLGNLVNYTTKLNDLDPGKITKIQILEDSVFDKRHSRFISYIVAMAPVVKVKLDGETIGEQVAFWVYYNDCKIALEKRKITNSGADINNMSYYDIFTNHLVKSYVIKKFTSTTHISQLPLFGSSRYAIAYDNKLTATLSVGGSYLYDDFLYSKLKTVFKFGLDYKLKPCVTIGGEALYGQNYSGGLDRNYKGGPWVKTTFVGINANLKFFFIKYAYPNPSSDLGLFLHGTYIGGGLGYLSNLTTDLEIKGSTANPLVAPIKSGQSMLYIPLNLGINIDLPSIVGLSGLKLNVNYQLGYCISDYLEGYNPPSHSNAANDVFSVTSVGISFHFKNKQYNSYTGGL